MTHVHVLSWYKQDSTLRCSETYQHPSARSLLQQKRLLKVTFVSVCVAGAEAVYNKQYLTIMAHSLGKNPANVLGKCHHASGGQQTQSGVSIDFCIPHPGSQRTRLWGNSCFKQDTPTIFKISKLAKFSETGLHGRIYACYFYRFVVWKWPLTV